MKALLLHPDRDYDPRQALPWQAPALIQDLQLETLFRAMAGEDEFLLGVARHTVLSGLNNDMETIRYRLGVLQDCLSHPTVVRQLYDCALEAITREKAEYYGSLARNPSLVLYSAIKVIEIFIPLLRRLRDLAEATDKRCASRGLQTLFAMLKDELGEPYLAEIQGHLDKLKFRRGVLLSAELGKGNRSTHYRLCKPAGGTTNWLARLFEPSPRGYRFRLQERDERGGQLLSDMKDRGIDLVANALAQARDHILSFFVTLRTELAFYLCGINLHDRLTALGVPVCIPLPEPAGQRLQRFSGLYDPCLALTMGRTVVGNSADADGRRLVIVTGANQGGKSSFLRSLGVAHLMMQAGLFVSARRFEAELCMGLFTHYRREEDQAMKSGRLDEELSRLSDIADHIGANALLLLNESFSATNEREGSEIARQVVSALIERGVKIVFVTHQYEFARGCFEGGMEGVLFLRAQREADGTRTFKLVQGEPLPSSFGGDLYRQVFGAEAAPAALGESE